jgi:hypothetical protein
VLDALAAEGKQGKSVAFLSARSNDSNRFPDLRLRSND